MKLTPDLHLHTTCSDGLLAPEQIVPRAQSRGLNLIAVTDHDTLSGLERVTAMPGITVVPGVELSASHAGREVHILGYGVSPEKTGLKHYLVALRAERRERAARMLTLLQKAGLMLSPDELDGISLAPGRMHVARLLIQKGYVKDTHEAFDRWLSKGKPGFVSHRPRVPSEVIRMLRADGIVPVLAHPARIKLDFLELEALLTVWQDAGLQGLEVYHRANEPFERYDRMAKSHGLLITGGSDFHGDPSHPDMGDLVAAWSNRDEDGHRFLEAVSHTLPQ